jgi:ribose transport system substrate-binding protein
MRRKLSRFHKGGLAVIAAVAIAALLSIGVGRANSTPSKVSAATSARHLQADQYRIALVIPDFTQNELILDLKNGAQAAAKKYHVKLLVTGTGAAEDQVKAIKDAIAAKVDAIDYDTTDAAALTPVIIKANKAHIPVVCNTACASGGKNQAIITFNYKTMGLLTGKWIASKLKGGQGTVGIVDTNRTDSSVQQIYTGINAGLAAAGAHPKIVISPPTNWDPAAARTVTQNFLTANPNLDVLICLHDLVANVCRQVMDSMNYHSIALAGEGGTCQGLSNLLTGKMDFTVAQFLYSAGYMSIQQAVQILHGKHAKSTTKVAPMIGITSARAKAWANGSTKIPPGLGLEAAVAKAKAGCK